MVLYVGVETSFGDVCAQICFISKTNAKYYKILKQQQLKCFAFKNIYVDEMMPPCLDKEKPDKVAPQGAFYGIDAL